MTPLDAVLAAGWIVSLVVLGALYVAECDNRRSAEQRLAECQKEHDQITAANVKLLRSRALLQGKVIQMRRRLSSAACRRRHL